MSESKFRLVDAKFIVLDGKLIFEVDPDYAGPVMDQIRFVEKQYDAEKALRFAGVLAGKLAGKLYKPDDASMLMFNVMSAEAARKAGMGTKVACGKCSKKYWTMNRPDSSCPICPKPAPTAVLSTKQGE